MKSISTIIWTEIGAQPALEMAYDVMSAPSLLVIDTVDKSSRFEFLGSPIEATKVAQTLSQSDTPAVVKSATIQTVTPWDGEAFAYPQH